MTVFADYNSGGTTRTSKRGIARHAPLLPDHFNHRWFDAYVDDFLSKNILENDGVVSGCVISQDGGNDAINITSGVVYIGGVQVPFTSSGSPYVCTTDGWYIVYINNSGVITYGLLENNTTQGAITPDDSIVVGFAVRGNGVFYIASFFNEKDELVRVASLDDDTKHIQPTITVGPTLSNLRTTHLETTFIAALANGNKLLFLDSTVFTASRVLTTEAEVWMDGPDDKLDIATFDLTFVEVSGKISVTASTGKIILNGKTHGLVIIGNVVVEQGANFSGTYSKDGELFYAGQIIPTSNPQVWGTETQVDNLDANFYTNAAGAPLDKNDAAYTLSDDDEILINHNATLAANLKLQPVSSKILKIGMAKGITLNFGDAGSGVPYKAILGGNIAEGSDIFMRGTFDFRKNTLSDADKRLIANQAIGLKIKYNRDVIYDPNHTGDVVTRDTKASNPYLLEYDGAAYDWLADASNTTKSWFRDLNVYLDGLVYNGSTYDETRGRFTDPAGVAYKFQVNTGFGLFRQISGDNPDIHSQTDINGVSVADTASFVSGTNIVTFVSITDIKNGMRINGANTQGILDGTNGTTILKNVDTTAKTAEMIVALTGVNQNANATVGSIAVTMDNSGAAGGSKQEDEFEAHNHVVTYGVNSGVDPSTLRTANGVPDGSSAAAIANAGGSTESRGKSTGAFFYQRP